LLQSVVADYEKELQVKQKRREEIRMQQEQARLKRERDRLENERKVREHQERLLAVEVEEARRADLLVKELEKKEQEWISRLRTTQTIQETAFEHLEAALLLDDNAVASPYLKMKERSPSAPTVNRSSSVDSTRKRSSASGGIKIKR
jgi:NADPH-dependent glutamate synthase beta subunit-like oxidoreductase